MLRAWLCSISPLLFAFFCFCLVLQTECQQAPPNDNCVNATIIEGLGTFDGTLLNATTDNFADWTEKPNVFYQFISIESLYYSVQLNGNSNLTLRKFYGCENWTKLLDCQPDSITNSWFVLFLSSSSSPSSSSFLFLFLISPLLKKMFLKNSLLEFTGLKGDPFYLMVEGDGDYSFSIVIDGYSRPNNFCENATQIYPGFSFFYFSLPFFSSTFFSSLSLLFLFSFSFLLSVFYFFFFSSISLILFSLFLNNRTKYILCF